MAGGINLGDGTELEYRIVRLPGPNRVSFDLLNEQALNGLAKDGWFCIDLDKDRVVLVRTKPT